MASKSYRQARKMWNILQGIDKDQKPPPHVAQQFVQEDREIGLYYSEDGRLLTEEEWARKAQATPEPPDAA